MSAEEARALADTPTPRPREGRWMLVSPMPECHAFTGASPMACLQAEMDSRIPARVQLARMRVALDEDDGGDEWRAAVDDMLATCGGVASDDPRESLDRLISWHVQVALDPSVSSDGSGRGLGGPRLAADGEGGA